MDQTLLNLSIDDFAAALASRAPTPGGGGVAGLEALNAAALALMVLELTLGKEKYREFEEENQTLYQKAKTLFSKAQPLMDRDQQAFLPLSAAYRLPAGEQKQQAIAQAVEGAINAPLEVIDLAEELSPVLQRLVLTGSKLALSDVGVGAMCLMSAVNNAWLNVLINLSCMTDVHKRTMVHEKTASRIRALTEVLHAVYVQVEKEIYQS